MRESQQSDKDAAGDCAGGDPMAMLLGKTLLGRAVWPAS